MPGPACRPISPMPPAWPLPSPTAAAAPATILGGLLWAVSFGWSPPTAWLLLVGIDPAALAAPLATWAAAGEAA